MIQSRWQSMWETVLNVFSGMLLGFAVSGVFHLLQEPIANYLWSGFKWEINSGSNVIVTCTLTVVSVARSYSWRRYFNKRLQEQFNDQEERVSNAIKQ